jgi:hypothetical protein
MNDQTPKEKLIKAVKEQIKQWEDAEPEGLYDYGFRRGVKNCLGLIEKILP